MADISWVAIWARKEREQVLLRPMPLRCAIKLSSSVVQRRTCALECQLCKPQSDIIFTTFLQMLAYAWWAISADWAASATKQDYVPPLSFCLTLLHWYCIFVIAESRVSIHISKCATAAVQTNRKNTWKFISMEQMFAFIASLEFLLIFSLARFSVQ